MLLNLIIWIPIAVGILLLVVPFRGPQLARAAASFASFGSLALSLVAFLQLRRGELPPLESSWSLDALGVSYSLGLTQVSVLLLVLANLVGCCAIAMSGQVTRRAREFYGLLLLMVGGISGAFCSLDLFFFYVFHEVALVPTFLLVGFWGGEERRSAALRMVLFLGAGSLVLLAGIVLLYLHSGSPPSFYLPTLRAELARSPIAAHDQTVIFGILLLGFGTLIGAVPVHVWAPEGYAEAPPAAAMIHAGVLKKFGVYGLLAVAIPLLPEGFHAFQRTMAIAGVLTILYAGYLALAQHDLARMLGYSSVSHLGYALLGLAAATPLAREGVIYLMLAHGLSAALGFGVAGFSQTQTHTREMRLLGGLAGKMPAAATLFTLAALAGCGLPGMGNFVAELLVYLGSFGIFPWLTILAVWGVVVSATYYLRSVQRVFLGPVEPSYAEARDMNWLERLPCFALALALLALGFAPSWLTRVRPLPASTPPPPAVSNAVSLEDR